MLWSDNPTSNGTKLCLTAFKSQDGAVNATFSNMAFLVPTGKWPDRNQKQWPRWLPWWGDPWPQPHVSKCANQSLGTSWLASPVTPCALKRWHDWWEGGFQLSYLYAELLINTWKILLGKKVSFAFNMRHSTWCLRKYLKALPEVERIQVDPGRWNVNGFSVSINLLNKCWEWKLQTNERYLSWLTCPTAADLTWFWVND